MWIIYDTFDYYINDDLNLNVSNIYILNVDYGIAWNPYGGKYPYEGNWIWSSPTTPKYINNLINNNNNMCILQSEYKNSKSAIDEMQKDLNKNIYSIIGIPLYVLVNILKSKNNSYFKLPINNEYKIITIPKLITCDGLEMKDVSELNIPLVDFDNEKKLIIMMGQEGSGKTTYAKTLQDKGYLIISEPLISSIKRKNIKSVNILKEALKNNKLGVIIDSSNPVHNDRLIYSDIAKELNISSIILWVSRPGYKFNNLRNQKIPETILNIYSKIIQPPNFYNIPYIRVI